MTAKPATSQKPTKQRILDAAEMRFAQRGYEATSVVEIAEMAGIRGPAIYKHFTNKQSVFEAVLTRLFDPFSAMLEQHAAVEATPDAMSLIINHHIQNPNISKIIQHATLAGGKPLEILVEQWYIPFFAQIIEWANRHDKASIDTLMAFHSMLLGYITLAPLHEKIFRTNPLDKKNIEAQLQLQQQLSQFLLSR